MWPRTAYWREIIKIWSLLTVSYRPMSEKINWLSRLMAAKKSSGKRCKSGRLPRSLVSSRPIKSKKKWKEETGCLVAAYPTYTRPRRCISNLPSAASSLTANFCRMRTTKPSPHTMASERLHTPQPTPAIRPVPQNGAARRNGLKEPLKIKWRWTTPPYSILEPGRLKRIPLEGLGKRWCLRWLIRSLERLTMDISIQLHIVWAHSIAQCRARFQKIQVETQLSTSTSLKGI